jgi:hypothetical protein
MPGREPRAKCGVLPVPVVPVDSAGVTTAFPGFFGTMGSSDFSAA